MDDSLAATLLKKSTNEILLTVRKVYHAYKFTENKDSNFLQNIDILVYVSLRFIFMLFLRILLNSILTLIFNNIVTTQEVRENVISKAASLLGLCTNQKSFTWF